jgi:hypothetical protein
MTLSTRSAKRDIHYVKVNRGVTMKISSFAAILIVAATVASAQEMPGDYAGVLKTLDKKGDYTSNVLKSIFPVTI